MAEMTTIPVSKKTRDKLKLWGSSFWSDGYFYETIGRVTSDAIEYYINRQRGRHWAQAKTVRP